MSSLKCFGPLQQRSNNYNRWSRCPRNQRNCSCCRCRRQKLRQCKCILRGGFFKESVSSESRVFKETLWRLLLENSKVFFFIPIGTFRPLNTLADKIYLAIFYYIQFDFLKSNTSNNDNILRIPNLCLIFL